MINYLHVKLTIFSIKPLPIQPNLPFVNNEN